MNVVDEPNLKLARVNRSRLEGRRLVLRFHYMRATNEEICHRNEELPMFLFTREEYQGALEQAGLAMQFDERGIAGQGLFAGVKSG